MREFLGGVEFLRIIYTPRFGAAAGIRTRVCCVLYDYVWQATVLDQTRLRPLIKDLMARA